MIFLNKYFDWPTNPDTTYNRDVFVPSGLDMTDYATRGSESATTGSGSFFSVGDWAQCGVLHGDYMFST